MIRMLTLWVGATALTVYFATLTMLSTVVDKKGNLGFACMAKWARGLLWLGGIKFSSSGFDNLQKDGNYLFLPNHQSMVDIIALSACIPVKFGWMAKESLFKIPFLGWAMMRMGFIPVNRKSVSSSTRSLFKAADALKKGRSLVVFPEGSRSKDGNLKPFKDGAFFLAVESGASIVPISVVGTRDIIKKGSSKVYPGEVRIIASQAIDVKDYSHSSRDKLKEIVRGKISSNLRQI